MHQQFLSSPNQIVESHNIIYTSNIYKWLQKPIKETIDFDIEDININLELGEIGGELFTVEFDAGEQKRGVFAHYSLNPSFST